MMKVLKYAEGAILVGAVLFNNVFASTDTAILLCLVFILIQVILIKDNHDKP